MGCGSSIYEYKKFVVVINDMQSYLQASKSNIAKINSISKYMEVLALQDKKEIARVQSEIIKQLFQLTLSFVFELIFYINNIINEIAHEFIRPSLLTKSVNKSPSKSTNAESVSMSALPSQTACSHNYTSISKYTFSTESFKLEGLCNKCNTVYSDSFAYGSLAKLPALRHFKIMNETACFICNQNVDCNHKVVCPCNCICHVKCLCTSIRSNFNQVQFKYLTCAAHKRIVEQPFIRSIIGDEQEVLIALKYFNSHGKSSKCISRY